MRRRRRSAKTPPEQVQRTRTARTNSNRQVMVAHLLGLLLALWAQPGAGLSYAAPPQQPPQSIGGLQQSLAQLLQVFNGNDSATHADANHFRLLERQGDFLLVGARNVVYNLSLSSMREQRRLEWPSSAEDVNMCRVKGKSPEQCQNYIRVLKLQTPDTLFVCGTNAYKPRCRTYLVTSNAYELVSESPGEGACPYQENQNVTSLFVDGDLYSATAAQFSGIDGLIHRAPLRTEQFNPKQLNSPNFVSSFRYGEHVYFLFRESAIEHINCGKTIYSRIARVCINDSGGATRASRERWTSFVKARLNCSIPGEFPFYFDEIQASTHVVSGQPQVAPPAGQLSPASDLLYAVFTTPRNSIGGSAVCAFRMSDVQAAFEGPFKSQATSTSNWLPVADSRVPQPRPGTCVNDSKQLPDENINFIKDNPLMDVAVEAVWSQPLIMMASINFRFTQIAVDAQVETQPALGAASMRTDVIFVATDDGRVFKLINTQHLYAGLRAAQPAYSAQPYYMSPHPYGRNQAPLAQPQVGPAAGQVAREPLPDVSGNTIVIEELHLFDSRTPIVNMLIHHPPATSGHHAKLLVLASRQLKAVPLARCERALTCADCLALYDPYCTWDQHQLACLATGRSAALLAQQRHAQHPNSWFPANNLAGSNLTLAWWQQCPSSDPQGQPAQQVGAPFRSLFSSHLQVPSRFDYASGHHLSHTTLVSLAPSYTSASPLHRQQPVSECLTFCGGLYTPQVLPAAANSPEATSQQLMMNCADYVQQHYIGNLQGSTALLPTAGTTLGQIPGNLYTSENLYFAVIICAAAGLILGLLFGFVLGKNTRKHDSSVCSSTFDETNLYMASTGSHHGANLFAAQQQQQQRLHHPLLQQTVQNGLLGRSNGTIQPGQLNNNNHLFEATQSLLHDGTSSNSNYGNQQMLLHLTGLNALSNGNATSVRTGALPPLPVQAAPLVCATNSTTHINHSQLTPNSVNMGSNNSKASSSTNTSSSSTTVPANDHHNQLYLNAMPTQNHHQRTFTSNSNTGSTGKGSARLMDASGGKLANGKNSSFLQQAQQQQQQLQQQQQNNKIYL